MCVCPYRKRLEPLLDDKSLHQVSQNLSSLRPRPRLPGGAQRLAQAVRLVFRLVVGLPRLGFGPARSRFVDLVLLLCRRRVLRQAEVGRVGALSGEEGWRVFCRGGDEG